MGSERSFASRREGKQVPKHTKLEVGDQYVTTARLGIQAKKANKKARADQLAEFSPVQNRIMAFRAELAERLAKKESSTPQNQATQTP